MSNIIFENDHYTVEVDEKNKCYNVIDRRGIIAHSTTVEWQALVKAHDYAAGLDMAHNKLNEIYSAAEDAVEPVSVTV